MKTSDSTKIYNLIQAKDIPIKGGVLKVIATLIISILVCFTIYIFLDYRGASNLAAVINRDEPLVLKSKTNLERLSEKIWLPKESAPPRIFEISDPVQLSKEQPFYEGAIVGDILIIFNESKRAIIYSPKRDIIINTGTFTYVDDKINILEMQ